MTHTVRNAAGDTVQIAETPFAQGGEAAVHAVQGYDNVVVKLYHPPILKERKGDLQAKIEAMSSDKKFAHLKAHKALGWAHFSVFDNKNEWRGYAMKKGAGVRMCVLAHAKAYQSHFPQLNRPSLVSYLLNLLNTIKELHAAHILIGDYNPANFLCDPKSSAVTLIDCDSWQVSAAGKRFYCPMSVADMLAPELHGKKLETVLRSIESEHFSVAILLFKALMLGRHPFDAVGGSSPVENIKNGYFPYGLDGGGIPKGDWYNIWSHLPYKLKAQFVRTFKEGSQNPACRTSVAEWIELFKCYQREMEKGWHDTAIKPATPKTKEYRGTNTAISQPLVA